MSTLEGSEVLERLAEIDGVDDFYAAVDADDFARAEALLRRAGVEREARARVLEEMREG